MTAKIDPFTVPVGFLGPPPLTTATTLTTPQTSIHACRGLSLAAAATTTIQQPLITPEIKRGCSVSAVVGPPPHTTLRWPPPPPQQLTDPL